MFHSSPIQGLKICKTDCRVYVVSQAAGVWDQDKVMSQLRSSGLLEAVKIMRASYQVPSNCRDKAYRCCDFLVVKKRMLAVAFDCCEEVRA